ncbi:MAG TPA: hypothetical protein VEH27_19565 [Methylomirabilota bacterium]|nr:hypothetical protein [Methylomirabilota bacterium]
MKKLSAIKVLGWVAIATLLCGCAVLTVDVDVYKGPLANTEEIQGEQVISLAMGAKPLLVQLRDHLEVANFNPGSAGQKGGEQLVRGRSDADLRLQLYRFRTNDYYNAGWISPSTHNFKSELAIRVNEILGLYGDQAPPSLSARLEEIEKYHREYTRAYNILEPVSASAGSNQWQRWRAFATTTNETVLKGYDQFFSVSREGTDITNRWRSKTLAMTRNYVSTNNVSTNNAATNNAATNNAATNNAGRAEARAKPLTTEQQFKEFVSLDLPTDADEIFGRGDSVVKAQFLLEVRGIVESYFDAREALRRLLRLHLISVQELHAMEGQDVGTRRICEAFARVAANMLSLTATGKSGEYNKEGLEKPEQEGSAATERDVEQFRDRAFRALMDDPRFAGKLLATDQRLASQSGTPWPYGLTRGPTEDFGAVETSNAALRQEEQAYRNLFRAAAMLKSPLDGGRLRLGLESAIEEYLNEAETLPTTSDRLRLAVAQRLLASLVAFGQKVAQLGNSIVLLDDADNADVRQYIAVLQSVGNSILVHVDELKQQALYHGKLDSTRTLVSQELKKVAKAANGIDGAFDGWTNNGLDAKDAIIHLETILRTEYVKALIEGTHAENAAALTTGTVTVEGATNATINVTSRAVALGITNDVAFRSKLTNSADQPSSNSAAAVAEVKPVATTEGAVPPAGSAAAVSTSTSNVLTGSIALTNTVQSPVAGERIRKAIEAVTEIHEGMIYLRPASAYLRSSYPAATLGKGSSQRQINMLERASWRQFPFFGSLIDGIDHRDLKTYLEIDKQSWQNINNIKVAGGGKVNYVVAKDDVGNWYVKQYKTNRDKMFNTMRNAALFSVGNTFGGALPIRGADGNAILQTNPVLRVQMDKARDAHIGRMTNILNELAVASTNLARSITNSFSTNTVAKASDFMKATEQPSENLAKAFQESRDRLFIVREKKGDLVPAVESELQSRVSALRAFVSESESKIAELEDTKKTAEMPKAVREKTFALINKSISGALASLSQWRDNIAVIRTGAD